jgi:hypothetical protein
MSSKVISAEFILMGGEKDKPGTRWQGHTTDEGQIELDDFEELCFPPVDWPKGTKIVVYVPVGDYREWDTNPS